MRTYSLNRLLALFASAGFLFLAADTIIEHFAIIRQDLPALVGPLFSIVAAIAGFVAVARWNSAAIRVFHAVLLASFLVAGTGMYFHLAEEDGQTMTAEQQEHEKKEGEKPPLAPLAFGGVAVAGLLGTSRKWPAEVLTDSAPENSRAR